MLALSRSLKRKPALGQAVGGGGHEGVFGGFVGGFVGDTEAEEGAGVVPGDGDDGLLGDEELAGGFGVFELCAVGAAAGGANVKEISAAGHLSLKAGAAEGGDEFFQPPLVLGAGPNR